MRSADTFRAQSEDILKRCKGAYSERTLRGYLNDLKLFANWCGEVDLNWMPAEPQSIAQFVDEQAEACAISTVKRRIEAIKFAHRINDLPSPIANSCVALALRRAARSNPARPKQSAGLTHTRLEKMLAACPTNLAGQRDAALLSIGYDALARSSELALLEVSDVSDGRASILIPRAKNDSSGQGRQVHLSPRSKELLSEWLSQSNIRKGPLFRGLHTGKPSCQAMNTSSIRRLVKRAARRAKL